MTPKLLKSFLTGRTGGTAVEYGLLVALISVGLITGLSSFSDSLQDMLGVITGTMDP